MSPERAEDELEFMRSWKRRESPAGRMPPREESRRWFRMMEAGAENRAVVAMAVGTDGKEGMR